MNVALRVIKSAVFPSQIPLAFALVLSLWCCLMYNTLCLPFLLLFTERPLSQSHSGPHDLLLFSIPRSSYQTCQPTSEADIGQNL